MSDKHITGLQDNQEGRALLSHDLRSAVAAVIGGLQVLDTDSMSESDQSQIAQIASSAGLVLRLLESYERRSETTGVPTETSVNVAQFLKDLEFRWRGRFATKDLDFDFKQEINPDVCLICNALDLERMLSNLLENAFKYTDQGGVSFRATQQGEQITFAVADDGAGFSSAALSKLFTFGGRPGDSPRPGSGLGLYSAQRIAWRLKGRIVARNTQRGALIEAHIPLSKSLPSLNRQNRDSAQHLAGKRVLLAEDNKTNQIVASQMLAALGASVFIANDGIEAWEALQAQEFDVAILDIEMPGKSGLELIRDMRATKGWMAQMPIIALTAYVLNDHRARIMQTGANGIIAKPLVNIDEFGRSIVKYCQLVGQTRLPDRTDAAKSPVDKQVYFALKNAVGADVFEDLLQKLAQDLADVETELKQGFNDNNMEMLRVPSHTLISLAGAIGAMALHDAARALNSTLHGEGCVKLAQHETVTLELLAELTLFLRTTHGDFLSSGSNGD